METSKLDIVYCVKDSFYNEELRYSLRSLCNLPHAKVWIYGIGPNWLTNVEKQHPCQNKNNKWLNARFMLDEICKNDSITENFIWFNDDFFVMKPTEEIYDWYDRTLEDRAGDFSKKSVGFLYPERLKKTAAALRNDGFTTDNFELHLPIIFNRERLLELSKQYPDLGAIRSIYKNINAKDKVQRNDVKIYDRQNYPNIKIDFLSTTDDSFRVGKVGRYIRNIFDKPCEYEKEYYADSGLKKAFSN